MPDLSKAQVYATLAQAMATLAAAYATAGYTDDMRGLLPKIAEYTRQADEAITEALAGARQPR